MLLVSLFLSGITINCFGQEIEKKSSSVNAGSIDKLLVGLRLRLEKEPNDIGGWVLLAKSYHHLDRWHEAEKAAAKARALGFKGNIFPGERSIAPNSQIKGHHNAGAMVSSFFDKQSSESSQYSNSKSPQDQ